MKQIPFSQPRHTLSNLSFPCSTLVLFACFFANAAFGQIYVATTGLDAAGRGTQALPYKTIVYAVQQAAAGSTIYITASTTPYNETNAIWINKALTLIKTGTGSVIIDGTNRGCPASDIYMLGIVSTSNVTIDGLTFRNFICNGAKGIWLLGSGNNINIKNCTLTNIGWKSNDLVAAPSSSSTAVIPIKVEGNSATAWTNVNITKNAVNNCATGWAEAITITGNVNGFVVDGNTVNNISNIGIVAAGNYPFLAPSNVNQARNGTISNNVVYNCMSSIAASAGIYLDGAVNITVEKNKVYNCAVGISVGGEKPLGTGASPLSGHKIRNNLVYDNSVSGIVLGTNVASNAIQSTNVYNNTFYRNRSGKTINGVTTIAGTAISTVANIWGGDVHLQNIASATLQNNIIYPLDDKRAMVALGGYTVTNFNSNYNVYFKTSTAIYPLIDLTGLSFNGSTTKGSYNTLAAFTTATKSTTVPAGLEANSLYVNPGFTNVAGFDFSLTTTAGAGNVGNPTYNATLSGTTDLANAARVFNNIRIDAGAYESKK